MEEGRIPKKALEENFDGNKIVGSPRVQWKEMVMKVASNLLDFRKCRTIVDMNGKQSLKRIWSEQRPRSYK